MIRRIAVVVSHPIQHFCPQYSSWTRLEGIELKVFFASRHGLDPYVDKDFGRKVQWDGLVLDFPHEYLPGASDRALTADIDCDGLDTSLAGFAPDAVIVYGYMQPLQRRAIRWAKGNMRRLLMISDSELRTPRRSRFKQLAKKLLLPRIFKTVDAFLTVGDANEQYYRTYGVDDRRLVRCSFPIDIASFDAMLAQREAARLELRAAMGIPVDHLVLLMVGKLVHSKRQRDLVELANRSRQGQTLTVVLAGSGPDLDALQELAHTKGVGGVVFAGFVNPRDLVAYYAAADVYVHCSEVEAHSLAISEAIYSGLPVLISDRCGSFGPSDDVRPGLNGFVYECGNVGMLADAIAHLANDRALASRMGCFSREIGVANQALAHGVALRQACAVIDLMLTGVAQGTPHAR
jgi:glycosyltransferase involved in cell wall biosynthesis